MTPTGIDHDAVMTGLARSAVYRFASRALAFPDPDRLAEHRATARDLLGASTGDAEVDRHLAAAIDTMSGDGDALRRAHTEVFPPIELQDHPPHESAYASSDIFVQTDVMADVAAFYRAHGLRAGGRDRERPDHICTELDFMGFMGLKEAHALEAFGPAEVAECRRTQVAFLRDHLGCWGPAFGARLATAAPAGPYRVVGRFLRVWIELDMRSLRIVPDRVLDTPHPPPPPDDGSCGVDGVSLGTFSQQATPVELRRSPRAR